MAVCLSCNAWMEGNPSTCSFCGEPILKPDDDEMAETIVVKDGDELRRMVPRQWQSADVASHTVIELSWNGTSRKVKLPRHDPVILGRDDGGSAAANAPDVDLTEFEAFDKGVSRLHAALRMEGSLLMVRDLDSTNGTYINGQRVSGHGWRVVRDQDELRLGTLKLEVNFDTTAPLSSHFDSDGSKRPLY